MTFRLIFNLLNVFFLCICSTWYSTTRIIKWDQLLLCIVQISICPVQPQLTASNSCFSWSFVNGSVSLGVDHRYTVISFFFCLFNIHIWLQTSIWSSLNWHFKVFVCHAAELSTGLRQHGTAPCTTLCCWTESLPMGRRSTSPSLLI